MASVRVRTVGSKQNKNQNILIALLFFEMRVKSQKRSFHLVSTHASCVLANNVLRRICILLVIKFYHT